MYGSVFLDFGRRQLQFFVRGLLWSGVSHAQTKPAAMPDAQIEANVLKALAGAPELADQTITSTTVYGVVTLNGTVRDEPSRDLAEHLVANTVGVQKVVDRMVVSSSPALFERLAAGRSNPNLQSDGTIAPQSGAQTSPAPSQYPAPRANIHDLPPQGQYPQPYPGPSSQYPGSAKSLSVSTGTVSCSTEPISWSPSQYPAPPQQGGQYPQTYPSQQRYPQPYPSQAGQYPPPYPAQPGQYPPQYGRSLILRRISRPMYLKRVGMRWWYPVAQFCGSESIRP